MALSLKIHVPPKDDDLSVGGGISTTPRLKPASSVKFVEPFESPKDTYKYRGSSLKAKDIIEDRDGEIAYHSRHVFDVSREIKNKIAEDSNLTNLIAANRAQPTLGADQARDRVHNIINTYFTSPTPVLSKAKIRNKRLFSELIVNEICGYGPIQPLYEDEELSEIMLNTPFIAFVEYHGKMMPAKGCRFSSREHLVSTINTIASTVGREFNEANPIADFMLNDLSRVNAEHPVISILGPNLSIRKHMRNNFTMNQLMGFGSFNEDMFRDLAWFLGSGASLATAGVTSSGKTTLLTSAVKLLPRDRRIMTIEDTLELELTHPNTIVLQTRGGNRPITQNDLISAALRSRPDVIIVGEVREAAPLAATLQAAATGHQTMWSIHAATPSALASRAIQLLSSQGGMSERSSALALASALDIIVIQKRFRETGERKITGIFEVMNDVKEIGGVSQITFNPLWKWETTGIDSSGKRPKLTGSFVKLGEVTDEFRELHYLDGEPPSLQECLDLSDRKEKTTYELYEEEAGSWN